MPTPGAVSFGATDCAQADGPRLLDGSIASASSVPPTANASGRLAGLNTVPAVGPKLPAANTGRIPAARRLPRSGWKSRLQPPADIVQESLTTSGASAVAGFPSGSSSHWNPRWIVVEVVLPRSLKIFTAIHFASGATPIELPPASPPTMTPIVWVPCPFTSVGVLGCCPFGSYQLLLPPRQRPTMSGW